MLTFLCNNLNFIDFLFTWEVNLTSFRKFSQEMEHTRMKWIRYGGHMGNSNLFGGPLQFELSKFHCRWQVAVVVVVLFYDTRALSAPDALLYFR